MTLQRVHQTVKVPKDKKKDTKVQEVQTFFDHWTFLFIIQIHVQYRFTICTFMLQSSTKEASIRHSNGWSRGGVCVCVCVNR